MSRKPGHHHHKPAISEEEQAKTQLWHSFIDTVRLLPTVGERSAADERIYDEALDKLNRLTEMYDNPTISRAGPSHTQHTIAPPTINIATPSTPSSSLPPVSGGTAKRKRRPSISLSPAPASASAPTPSFDSITASPIPVPLSGKKDKDRSSTPLSALNGSQGKNRREPYSDQLPLQPGRRVAFRAPAGGNGEDEEWILVTIRKCLGDRTKYEVVDADDNKTTYSTTLKSIIPLPDPTTPSHLSSHPSQSDNHTKGTIVLALYPDTTAFYQATVVAAPIPGTGMGTSISRRADQGAKKGKYVLAFVDDGDNLHEVDAKDVVTFPS